MASSPDEKLREIVQHAYANVSAFKARLDAADIDPNDIRTRADLVKLPILSKDQLIIQQQNEPPFGGMLGVPVSEIRHIFMSPGPLYEPDAGEDPTTAEIALECLRLATFTADDVVLNTLSYHLVPAGLLVDAAVTSMGATVVPSGFGNTDLQIKLIADLGVTAYVGTPSFLMTLIKRAEEMGLDFRNQLKLKKALVSAEPLLAGMRQEFVETYGLSIANTYATAELGLLAVNTSEGLAMQLLAEPIIEIVDPETGQLVGSGEAGEIVVTNFNRAYPLIRFGTGDMAINVDPDFGLSQQSEREIIIVGRSGDAVKVRGMFVHPRQLSFAIGQVAQGAGLEVAAVQGVVTREGQRDRFVVRIATPQSESEFAAVEQMLKQAIQQACRVRADELIYVAPDAIAADARGMVDDREWESGAA